MVDHVDLALAHAHRLEEHVVLAGGIHQERRLKRRLGQPSERAPACHRADEHPRVEEVVGEPDAVTEHGALRERAGGIDREHPDLPSGPAELAGQRPDQGALADPGRARQPHDARPAGLRKELRDQPVALGLAVLDQADRPRQRPLVPGQQALGERLGGGCLGLCHGIGQSRVRRS